MSVSQTWTRSTTLAKCDILQALCTAQFLVSAPVVAASHSNNGVRRQAPKQYIKPRVIYRCALYFLKGVESLFPESKSLGTAALAVHRQHLLYYLYNWCWYCGCRPTHPLSLPLPALPGMKEAMTKLKQQAAELAARAAADADEAAKFRAQAEAEYNQLAAELEAERQQVGEGRGGGGLNKQGRGEAEERA